MKILLVALNSKFIHTNLALQYLKNNCNNKKIDIVIKEFTINQQIESITSQIVDEKPDILAFSCYIWNIEYIKKVAYILKTAKPKIKMVFGGPEVSFEMADILENNKFIDFIIYGEGEKTFNELISYFVDEIYSLSNIKGIAYREKENIVVNDKREPIENLDDINFPYDNLQNFKNKIIYYESSRGCPFNCSFCMSSIEKRTRFFSLDRVKRDLKLLLSTNARQIKFVDRTFNVNYKRSIEIMKYIVDHNKNNMTIHFEITANIITDEFLDFVKTVPKNMFQFEIGVQSVNDDTLNEINRKMDLEKFRKVVETIKSNNNIHQHLDLIAGLPYENYNSFKNSLNTIHNFNVEKIQLGFLKVLKGTQIYRDKEKHKIEYLQQAPYEVIKTKYISYEEILKLKKVEELIERYYNEMYFKNSIEYVIDNLFSTPFEFYENFSRYWDENDLFKIMHKRKKLYQIFYEFIDYEKKLNNEFISKIKYDYVFNNPNEELLSIFNKETEEDYRKLKHYIIKNDTYIKKYFSDIKADNLKKIINIFRIIRIDKSVCLFIYKNKNNIYDRCNVYVINDIVEEYDNGN